ncbi:MAG: hypothetical protein HY824_00495 [Acidobacteria bacterium]|nr:hypothetical protein [Acidobacteriota bacterium]
MGLAASGCAARRVTLPSDTGAPFPDFADAYRAVSASCAGVRTLTGELALAGRAGGRGIRGRAIVGFERPASMRLEGVAPFGPPAFILAARGGTAALLLPRDARVVRAERPEDILGALTGVALSPADLQAVMTGCLVPDATPLGGRLHQNGWVSIDLGGDATMYIERAGAAWRTLAGRRPGWEVAYAAWEGAFPRIVRLRSRGSASVVDLTATVAQLDTNVTLDPAAFSIDVPPGTAELSLEELRAAGPLRN